MTGALSATKISSLNEQGSVAAPDNGTANASLDSYEFFLPIVKSVTEKDGRLKVIGIATDASIDEQIEAVDAEANPDEALSYILKGAAVFDYDHNSDRGGHYVGRPTSARFIPADEARLKYPGWIFKGRPIEVEGYVAPVGPNVDLAPKDVKHLHYLAGIGEQLYMSIKAPAKKRAIIKSASGFHLMAVPGPITKIAITPSPVNTNTPCYLAKSVRGALGAIGGQGGDSGLQSATWESAIASQEANLLVVPNLAPLNPANAQNSAPSLVALFLQSGIMTGLSKSESGSADTGAMNVTNGIATTDSTGADVLKIQDLGGTAKAKNKAKGKAKGKKKKRDQQLCKQCGKSPCCQCGVCQSKLNVGEADGMPVAVQLNPNGTPLAKSVAAKSVAAKSALPKTSLRRQMERILAPLI